MCRSLCATGLYVLLRDQGLPHDVVAAVLDEQSHDPYRAAATALALTQLTQAPDWSDGFTAYAWTPSGSCGT